MLTRDLRLRIPGGVNDDSTPQGVAVGRVEPRETQRITIFAVVEVARHIGAPRCRQRFIFVGEVLQPTAMGRIGPPAMGDMMRSEEHTSELQSQMRISYAVFCLK